MFSREAVAGFVLVAFAGIANAGGARSERPKYELQPGDFTIVCTLFHPDQVPADFKVSLPDIPITYDAHILLHARVESVSAGASPWPPGTALRFLVHSPARMFGGYGFSGAQFSLTFSPFTPRTEDELVWFEPTMRYVLRAIEVVESEESDVAAPEPESQTVSTGCAGPHSSGRAPQRRLVSAELMIGATA
jgi:hypothetical protein